MQIFNLQEEERENYANFLHKLKSVPSLYVSGINCASIAMYIVYTLDIKLSLHELFELYYGCLIHDIGKTKVSPRLLNKKGTLSQEEKQIIKDHTEYGYEMIFPYIKSQTILDIVRYHHEKLNGSGYKSKTSEEISQFVQISTVADMYESITSDRPYRQAFSHKEAINFLLKDANAGKLNKDYVLVLQDYNKDKVLFNDIIELIKLQL